MIICFFFCNKVVVLVCNVCIVTSINPSKLYKCVVVMFALMCFLRLKISLNLIKLVYPCINKYDQQYRCRQCTCWEGGMKGGGFAYWWPMIYIETSHSLPNRMQMTFINYEFNSHWNWSWFKPANIVWTKTWFKFYYNINKWVFNTRR